MCTLNWNRLNIILMAMVSDLGQANQVTNKSVIIFGVDRCLLNNKSVRIFFPFFP